MPVQDICETSRVNSAMRNRSCRPGSSGAMDCNQRTCGPGCESPVPEIFQINKYHNVATSLREPNTQYHRAYPQGHSLHHPSCNCGSCNRGHHLPDTSFKDLLYRQSVDVGEGSTKLRSSQFHSHSQHNGCDRHCCGGGPRFHAGKRSADDLIERLRSTPRSSVFSASGDFEQRNASASAGFTSHAPLETKTNEFSSSSLDTTSNLNFHFPERAPPCALQKQISLHGWFLMKHTSGEQSSGFALLPGVAVGGYRSPQMLQTEFVQTARVERRLEKSTKLRTSDGMEVTLVGRIDPKKSIANGFSPVLVKYFLVGFPKRWIYMMFNLNVRGSMPDLPSSSVQQNMNNFAGQSHEPPEVAENSVLRAPTAALFTPPSEGTWKEALRSFSPPAINSSPGGSSDINTEEQCVLDEEQLEGQRNCSKVHRGADPQAGRFFPQRKTSSLTRDCPLSELEAIAVENADKVPDGSSQTEKPKLLWPRRPGLQGGMAGEAEEAGEDPESMVSKKSVMFKDVPALTPLSTLGEDVNEGPECSSRAQETQVVTDRLNSVEKVKGCCEDPQNIATEEGRETVDFDDFLVYDEHETELPSVEVPFTPLETSRQLPGDLTKLNTDKISRGVGRDPPKSVENLDNGRKLRSGRCLLVVDKRIRKQAMAREDAKETISTRKRRRNPKAFSSEGCKDVMRSREFISSTEDLLVHHDDTGKLGGLDQAPSTPSQKMTRPVNTSPGSALVVDSSTPDMETHPVSCLQNTDDTKKLRSGRYLRALDKPIEELVVDIPTTDAETHPVSCLQHTDDTKKRRSGRYLRALDKPIEELVFDIPTTDAETHPVTNLQNANDTKKLRSGRYIRARDNLVVSPVMTFQSVKSRKRRRITPSAVPAPKCEDDRGVECEGPPCSAVMEEKDSKEELQEHEGDSEVSSRPADEFCKQSAGVNRPLSKKRHRKLSKLYGSRRKKSHPESLPTSKAKLESSRSDFCSRRRNLKVGVDKSFQMEETKPTTKKNGTKVHQSSKTTDRAQLNRGTSRRTSQAGKDVQTGKRNSIVPPPLPAPRVADESKVIEAYGLKKSRYGRVLVPPLAVWCNQSIIYDMDGSIIAISAASSSEAESQTGCFNFTCPSDTGARKMQKKLLKAAQTDWSKK